MTDVYIEDNNIVIDEGSVSIKIVEYGNEIYWVFNGNLSDDNTYKITIDKNNAGLYELFEKMYEDIHKPCIYKSNSLELTMCSNYDSVLKMENSILEENLKLKNSNLYDSIVSENNISFRSEDGKYNKSNVLSIIREEDFFRVELNVKQSNYFVIKNQDSVYEPFNSVFYNMYDQIIRDKYLLKSGFQKKKSFK